MNKIKYNTNLYKFREQISTWLGTYDLPHLHLIKEYTHFDRENDQSTL